MLRWSGAAIKERYSVMAKRSTETTKVAFLFEGKTREVHATCPNGVFSTYCGLDADDPETGLSPSTPPRPNSLEQITCDACYQLWRHARKYRASDFARGRL